MNQSNYLFQKQLLLSCCPIHELLLLWGMEDLVEVREAHSTKVVLPLPWTSHKSAARNRIVPCKIACVPMCVHLCVCRYCVCSCMHVLYVCCVHTLCTGTLLCTVWVPVCICVCIVCTHYKDTCVHFVCMCVCIEVLAAISVGTTLYISDCGYPMELGPYAQAMSFL